MQGGGARQQVEGLKDEADFFVPDARQFVVIELADQLIVQPVISLAGRVEASDQVHQRGLAGTGGSHDGDVLVPLNAQIDSAQGVHLLFRAHVIGLPQVLGGNHARVRTRQHGGLRETYHFSSCHLLLLLVLWGHLLSPVWTASGWTSHPAFR